MVSEEQIEKIIERLVNRIEKANTYILMRMGEDIKKIRDISPLQAHQLAQIIKYGGEYDDIIKQLSKYTKINISDIDEMFKQFAKRDQEFNKKFYKYRNKPYIPYEKNKVLKKQTEELANVVKKEMYDYTRKNVLGYTIKDTQGNVQFLGLKETYNRVLDEAVLNVNQGKEGFDSAMSNILEEIGGSGLKTLNYESGRSIRLDSAIRMHLKSRLRELHNENQMLFGKQFDSDGVEISVHAYPAPDHASSQGRQFSTVKPSEEELSEYEKLQNGEDAKDYKGNIYTLDHDGKNGYRPISEMNCYHFVFSIILGVSEPNYSDEELKKIIDDNNKKIEYNGKKYTKYELSQVMRKIERSIRRNKDTQILAKASDNEGLIRKSQKNIDTLVTKYYEVSKTSGLPTKLERLQVEGYRKVKLD